MTDQLGWETFATEQRDMEEKANPDNSLCWACRQAIRSTAYGWGHLHPPKSPHTASPTKPVRRHKKVKETT